MTRVLSIWLPALAVERWTRSSCCPPDAPIVLTVEGTHGPVIHAVTRAAAERGAKTGARLTDARALDPTLVAVPADPDGDAALVQRLAHWAGRWSPIVEVDGDGLRLDVSGVAHLFGGECALVHDIERRFAPLGLSTRIAIAPTAAAAWALSHYAPSPQPLSRKRESGLLEQLAPLHVSALRLDADTVRTLERLGLKTVGALLDVPRRALARRFRGAEDVVDALDRALGRKPDPLTALPIDRPPRALVRFEEPATHPQAASQAFERLIPDLVRQLQERHRGVRRLSLTGFRVDGTIAVAAVATTIPSRDPRHLARLLADKAAALNPEFGFDAFALKADWTESLNAAQESLVGEPGDDSGVARLIDRLTVKLGPKRVRRPQPRESHVPECANVWVAAVQSSPRAKLEGRGTIERRFNGGGANAKRRHHSTSSSGPPPQPAAGAELNRPHHLLDRPEAIDVIYATPEGMPRLFVWRRGVHDIARAEGPERIAPEWWRQPSSARLRDYYRVEDSTGRRYWIYREGVIGDGRGGAPNWFIHGLFG
jgi:protein ImuB